MASSLQKLTNLFFHPSKFFKSVEKEKDYWPILLYLLTVNSIVVLIAAIVLVISFYTGSLAKDLPSQVILISPIIILIITFVFLAFAVVFGSLAGPFISSGINHLGVMIFGGKNGFFNTFKPTTYAMGISSLYGIISFVIFSISGLISPLSSIIGTILNIVIIIIGAIHAIYAQVIGISKFQNMSGGRAFLGIIIISLILFVLLIIPLIFLFAFLAALIPNSGVGI